MILVSNLSIINLAYTGTMGADLGGEGFFKAGAHEQHNNNSSNTSISSTATGHFC